MSDFDIHELWDEPWEGLPEDEAAWEWDLVSEEENGETEKPPHQVLMMLGQSQEASSVLESKRPSLPFDLCCAARVLFRAGLSVSIAGHLSVKIGPDRMLANRFGPSFGTLMPADILTLDSDGNILEGRGHVNDTIRLHGVIHKLNPECVAVAHTHPPAVVTFSALRALPEVYDQESCFLAGEVGLVEEVYSGLASQEERIRPMAEALRQHRCVILPNHGAITRGGSIQEAVFLMLLLEGMVGRHLAVQHAARATGITPRPLPPEVALATKKELGNLSALPLIWDDLMRKLQATDPALMALRPA